MIENWTADFETNNHADDCRVWAWGLYDIEKNQFYHGIDIESFFQFIVDLKKPMNIWFHNLKFDGSFILNYLLQKGYEHTKNKLKDHTFQTIISDTTLFYSIKVKIGNYNITFKDSLKKLPFSVSEVAKAFKLPILKGKINYDKVRPIGHKLTDKELKYLKHDCMIMGLALKYSFDEGNNKLTAGADALHNYKAFNQEFKWLFPILTDKVHKDISLAYKGGWTYCHKKGEVGEGLVLDVNSLYPWAIRYKELPYGLPIKFKGKYKPDKKYPLYIQQFSCSFELKKNKLPTVQLKNSFMFNPVEYLTSSEGETIVLTMTNIDMELFFEHYEVNELEYIMGYKFKSKTGMFNEYIDYHMSIKASETGAKRTLAKLMMNSLIGKFGTQLDVTQKIPRLENGVLKFDTGNEEFRDPVYMPVACFALAHSRYKTITSCQKVYHRFLYADTDSMHLKGTEIPEGLEIDDVKLGAWKIEGRFKKARFIRPKTYLEIGYRKRCKEMKITGNKSVNLYGIEPNARYFYTIKGAGMTKSVKKDVTWDNFKIGFKSENKLRFKQVKNGVILERSVFQLK